MQLNTASFYGKIEPFEAICVYLPPCFDITDHPCIAAKKSQINCDVTQQYIFQRPLHAGAGLVFRQFAFLQSFAVVV